jgi:hypothetical protein
LVIRDLEGDQVEQDLFLSVHHAASHTFDMSPAVKIIENHLGKAYMRMNLPQQPIPIIQTLQFPPALALTPPRPTVSYWKQLIRRLLRL